MPWMFAPASGFRGCFSSNIDTHVRFAKLDCSSVWYSVAFGVAFGTPFYDYWKACFLNAQELKSHMASTLSG